MAAMARHPHALSRARLTAEALALYVAAPLAMAVFVPPRWLFPVLGGFMLLALALLWQAGGFDWRGLLRGWRRVPWGEALALALGTLALCAGILALLRPEALFHFARTRPQFLLVIWTLYPLLSALPQELVYRPLFFHRYAAILPRDRRAAALLNAGAFSLAHLMYWSPLVLALTFAGGLVFARAYLRHGFPAAWVLHAVAGNALFAAGMGVWFYSGNVVRPF